MISSQTLNHQKMGQLLVQLEHRRKVAVLAWHSSVYLYGRSEKRMGMLEMLRRSGAHIPAVGNNCEHYGIIDREIIWYCSVNLLSN